MEPERMDLSALDPTVDRVGFERLVRRIMDAAAPELAGSTAEEGTVADALGLPAQAADWLTEGREPTESDLVLALERRR